MAEFPAFPLFTDAYLGDTTHLTTIEHGAYLLLLITAWRSKDGNLPDDDKMLGRYTKLNSGQWTKMRPILEAFFTVENGVWIQERLRDERDFVKQNSKRQSHKAKARWLKVKDSDKATAMPRECRNDAPHPTPPTSITNVIDNGFSVEFISVFWPAYPSNGRRKGDKKNSEKAFSKARSTISLDTIMKGLKNYETYLRSSGEYNADAATWINRAGWEDDYNITAAKTNNGGRIGHSVQAVLDGALANTSHRPEEREKRLKALDLDF